MELMKMKQEISYLNSTDSFQVIRISDIRCPLERIIPPHTEIQFYAFSVSICEVCGKYITFMIPERIVCTQLPNK